MQLLFLTEHKPERRNRAISFRPLTSERYLERPRLLGLLPSEPGFTVWLEAPYGYGKSILASQWTTLLEDDGWRIIWLALAEQQPKLLLAETLGLPGNAPWGVLLHALQNERTVLVFDDLDGSEDLAPLLRQNNGLLLLASRKPLPYPDLPQLFTQGTLLHLTATQLAFTEDEATTLFPDSEQGRTMWEHIRGWPLPLHFAALTGGVLHPESLLTGIRQSMSEGAWQEAQFMAALDHLPTDSALPATQELTQAGFLQALENGYRLHPLIRDAMITRFGEQIRQLLAANSDRLPPLLRGMAFERTGHHAALPNLLDDPDSSLHRSSPDTFLRWHRLAPEPVSSVRAANACIAQLNLNQFAAGSEAAHTLAADPDLAAPLRAQVISAAIFQLSAAKRHSETQEFISHALALPEEMLDGFSAGALSHSLANFHQMRGELEAAEQYYREALTAFARVPTGTRRAIAELKSRGNLLHVLWERTGHTDTTLAMWLDFQDITLLDDYSFVILQQNISVMYSYLMQEELALQHLRKALPRASGYFLLMGRVILAWLEQDTQAFPALFAMARLWEQNEVVERVGALWIRTLRRTGQRNQAFALRNTIEAAPFVNLEFAVLEAERGNLTEARELLEETRAAYTYREFRLQWHAAAYLINRTEEALDDLLNLTAERERLLRYLLIPLEALPRHRPELARAWPLQDVLASGWQEAIMLRLDEIPPLELRLLSKVTAQFSGSRIELTARQKQLLALFTLGLNRDEIMEALWPETDERKQRNNLSVQLNLLRKILEPWGISTFLSDSGLKHVDSDYLELQQALLAGDAQSTVRLYQEPFAPGADLAPVHAERLRLREQVVKVLLAAASAAPADQAHRWLARIMELEPLHEQALQQLLPLLIQRGRRFEALRLYSDFAQRLKLETDLEPLPKTAALLQPAS